MIFSEWVKFAYWWSCIGKGLHAGCTQTGSALKQYFVVHTTKYCLSPVTKCKTWEKHRFPPPAPVHLSIPLLPTYVLPCPVQFKVCSVQYAVCSVQFAVYSVQCALSTVHCEGWSVQFAVCIVKFQVCTCIVYCRVWRVWCFGQVCTVCIIHRTYYTSVYSVKLCFFQVYSAHPSGSLWHPDT